MIRKAVIAAAGLGTRFLPQTKAMPKEMLPILDKPIIQHIVEELVEAGIEDIVIVTGYHKRSIEDHFAEPNQELCCTHDALGVYTCQALPAGQCASVGGVIVVSCDQCPPITKSVKKSWGTVKGFYR